MNTPPDHSWQRFLRYYFEYPEIGLALDLSRMKISDGYFESMQSRTAAAFRAMEDLERGAIANPDEGRMVGHYWLRDPLLAPTAEIQNDISETFGQIKDFAKRIHSGELKGASGRFENLLLIGIGGSALGPQFVSHALGHPKTDKMKLFFFDNTDPDGMNRVLCQLEGNLGRTLVVVTSKSGGTKETRNGMLEAADAYRKAGLKIETHSVAITCNGSKLDNYAKERRWLMRFPMWDWVGGRTSVTSAVGLVPAALQGIDIDAFRAGAMTCDKVTRRTPAESNPAMLIALAWYISGNGRGEKDMIILPYRDRLELFSRYLQQLIMESLGKELTLHGEKVNQGISVYGNKGSTDQHAYLQQLRDGLNNSFVTFINALAERPDVARVEVEPQVTSSDYLNAFFLGTRSALSSAHRESISITIDSISPFSTGCLIALFERAVGFYSSIVEINAYNQPGVESSKTEAQIVLNTQSKILHWLYSNPKKPATSVDISTAVGVDDSPEIVFRLCSHLAANYLGIERIPGKKAEGTFFVYNGDERV